MGKISSLLNRINNNISAAIIIILTFLTVVDVTGRYVFNSPVPGTIEVTELLLVLIVYLAFGNAEQFNEHVVIDTAYEMMPPAVKRVLYTLAGLISTAILILMSWQMCVYAQRMSAGGYNTAVLGLPLHPVIYLGAFGAFCYALATISNIVKFFKGGEEDNSK